MLRALALALALPALALATPPREHHLSQDLDSAAQAPLTGVWLGTFRQYDPGRFMEYPMRMEVRSEPGPGDVEHLVGRFHWPTLRDGVTAFSGRRRGSLAEVTEHTLVRGSDLVLDGRYRISFRDADSLHGVWEYPPDTARPGFGTFELERTALPFELLPGSGSWLGEP